MLDCFAIFKGMHSDRCSSDSGIGTFYAAAVRAFHQCYKHVNVNMYFKRGMQIAVTVCSLLVSYYVMYFSVFSTCDDNQL